MPSGILVALLGAWLLMRQRRGDARAHPHETDRAHPHPHDHSHVHPHTHHHHAETDRLAFGSLVGLGLMHGVIPTPDALAVLLVALSVKRAFLGLALILSYSLGIAGVLSAIGILFLKSQGVMVRFSRFSALSKWTPAIAAVIVILLGLAIIARTVGM